jgi:serine/threonine-protein kinase PknK
MGMALAGDMPSRLAPGSRSWRFEPEVRVGQGATSDVWRARDTETDRDVAIKVGRASDAIAILAREADRLAWVSSPLVPYLIDVGVTPEDAGEQIAAGQPYLAMSWTAGSPLSPSAGRSAKQRIAVATIVARDIGGALADLHAAGTAHGDVKPENVLLHERGARLVDLGMSTDTGKRDIDGGTPRYLPPELWRGDPGGDAQARDSFALGLLIAEILDPALAGASDLAVMARKAALPAPFDRLCAALLAPDPGARPRASWISAQARIISADRDSEPDRRGRLVRACYLGSRRAEIARAARARSFECAVDGTPGEWLASAVLIARKIGDLRGDQRLSVGVRIGDADPLARARWLVGLAGIQAAGWAVAARPGMTDGDWTAALDKLAQHGDPMSWTLADLEAALCDKAAPAASPPPRSGDPAERAIEIALALSAADPAKAAIAAVEHGEVSSATIRRACADALRRLGETGRALALMAGDTDPVSASLRADIARRAGDREASGKAARDAISHDPADSRAYAVLARLCIDRGDPKAALTCLSSAPVSVHTEEARAIALVLTADRPAAEKALLVAQALATGEEARGRIAGLVGFVAHQAGDIRRASLAYAEAAEHAARAGSIVEEATYRTGEAACAVDEGDIARALSAAQRASLLWEHLGRPAQAARALLARAAALSTVGAKLEATAASHEARERARFLGDVRAQAFACWALTDVLDTGELEAADAARFALSALSKSENEEDRLRALARVLRHAPHEVAPDLIAWGDSVASRETTLVPARLEWWAARALGWLGGNGTGRAQAAILEICHLAARPAPVASRGPALAAGSMLAARLGDGTAARVLVHAQSEAARDLLARTPPDLRESAMSLAWVKGARAIELPGVSAEQIADFETLVRVLATRDRLRPLLEQVVDSLVLWTGVERGLLLLAAPGGKLVPRAARNLARADLVGEQLLLSHSIANRAIEIGEPVVAVDAAGEMPSVQESIHALKLRSVLAIPLVARGETLGVVYLDDRVRRGAFGPSELAWVRLVASLASVAIADAKDQILLRRSLRRAERAKSALGRELARREAELGVAEKELARVERADETRFRYDAIVGRSEATQTMLRLVDRVTVSEVPVLLIGESGSGKELVARAIHANGSRAGKMFVGENCAAIPEPLLESTLFGHVRGAFTGADRPRSGLFEIAHRGTLFLDEIGEMSLAMQSKLLRVLEDGLVNPLGSERGRSVDVRVIAATHRNLEEMVKQGRFREDLWYRLNVISIAVPPLRDRADDIPLLVHHFLEKHLNGRKVRVTADAMKRLQRYGWPGNVRQLENEIRRAIVLCDSSIDAIHLSADVKECKGTGTNGPNSMLVRGRVDALEADLVERALSDTRGNQTKAAEMLGLSRFGLQKMMKRLGIKAPG